MYELLIIELPYTLTLIIISVLGLLLGSFMEVVRSRGKWSKSFTERSICISCNKTLKWYELIPLVSYIALTGKCKNCGNKIPTQTFLAEVGMGILFLISFIFASSYLVFFICIFLSLFLLPIAIQDLENFEVPEYLSRPFTIIAFIIACVLAYNSQSILPFVYGFSLAAPFFLIWLISKGRAMGLGDAKIALPIGFFLTSFTDVLFVFFGTFWIGLALIIIYTAYKKVANKKSISRGAHIPLVPSMAIAYFIVILSNEAYCDLLPTLCFGV